MIVLFTLTISRGFTTFHPILLTVVSQSPPVIGGTLSEPANVFSTRSTALMPNSPSWHLIGCLFTHLTGERENFY